MEQRAGATALRLWDPAPGILMKTGCRLAGIRGTQINNLRYIKQDVRRY